MLIMKALELFTLDLIINLRVHCFALRTDRPNAVQ